MNLFEYILFKEKIAKILHIEYIIDFYLPCMKEQMHKILFLNA